MIVIKNKFIPFSGYKAMNILGIMFLRDPKHFFKIESLKNEEILVQNIMSAKTLNHENIHSAQIIEIMLVALFLTFPLYFFTFWFIPLILTLGSFYIVYGIEYMIKLCIVGKNKAYRALSFEREAYSNENNLSYLKSRKWFSWIKYIK